MSNVRDLASMGGGFDGAEYYNNKYWAPENHWALQEREFVKLLRQEGKVKVGDIYRDTSDAPAEKGDPGQP